MSTLHAEVCALLHGTFGVGPAALARAPGRVNLIGEHTDYNEGFVLPLAIEAATWVAAAAREDSVCRALSREQAAPQEWDIAGPTPTGWARYIAGVAALLRARGARLGGFDLCVASDVPVGGGLSSSAALEVAAALALAHLCGEPLETRELVDLCRQAEREYAGVPCGIMDQTASLLGRDGCALLLDCRNRELQYIPCEHPAYCLLVGDTGVRHELGLSAYAQRQQECAAGVEYFQRRDSTIRALRDIRPESVRAHAQQLDPIVAARCLHVTTEIVRTQAAAAALRRGDWEALGPLLRASHASLRDEYEVSCRELDLLADALNAQPGVLGARMTGAGFGGCVLAVVRRELIAAVTTACGEVYQSATGVQVKWTVTGAGPGAALVAPAAGV